MATQHAVEGGKVNICGYEFRIKNLRLHPISSTGVPCIRFEGELTDHPANKTIRGTVYDSGTYGGNHLVYTWDDDVPLAK